MTQAQHPSAPQPRDPDPPEPGMPEPELPVPGMPVPGMPDWTPAPVFPVFAQVEAPPVATEPARFVPPAPAPEPRRGRELAEVDATVRQPGGATAMETDGGFPAVGAPEPAMLSAPALQAEQRKTQRALAQVTVSFFVSLGVAVGLVYWIWFSDMLAPLRLAWPGPSPAASLLFRLVWCFVMGMFFLYGVWLVLLKLLAWSAGPSAAQTEQALREGGAQALASSRALMEKTLAEMRANGAAEADIADFRATMEEVQRTAQADHEARVHEWMRHPDRLQAHMDETVRRAQASQAAREHAGPARSA